MLFPRATSFWHVDTVTRLMWDWKLTSRFDLEMNQLTNLPKPGIKSFVPWSIQGSQLANQTSLCCPYDQATHWWPKAVTVNSPTSPALLSSILKRSPKHSTAFRKLTWDSHQIFAASLNSSTQEKNTTSCKKKKKASKPAGITCCWTHIFAIPH